MDELRKWVEESPYTKFLGVRLDHLDEKSARLILPYQDENSNPGKALHGGCAASLGAIGGQAVARAALGPDSGDWHTAQMQVSYLAAAIGEDVVAEAELLRRGKELCFAEVDVATEAGKPVAHATAVVRALFGAGESGAESRMPPSPCHSCSSSTAGKKSGRLADAITCSTER